MYLCFDTVKMAKVLTGIHERAGFPGSEELFSSANGYLVHHSPTDIFDVTITFLVPEMWILVYYMTYFRHFGSSYMCYCVDGGHLGRHLEFNPFCP